MQDRRGMGSQGACVCLGCNFTKPHSPGIPCREERCPKCGKAMVREGSEHHLAYIRKQEKQGKTP
jgi:uncharacterized paraquat-inducible protein A